MRCATFAVVVLLACAPACNEIRKCQRGELGCLAGPPDDGRCAPGLVLNQGACAEPGAAPTALECGCEDGQVCTLDAYACVDYCAPVDAEIGTAPPRTGYSCDAEGASAAELCESRCLIRCRAWKELCPSSGDCGPESCRSDAELAACEAECGSEPDPVQCLARACNEQSGLGCRELACPEGRAPRCAGVTCQNTCSGFNFDGVCDDGDLASAQSGVCAFGTDCADCGPRQGAAPKPLPQGEACAFHSNCAGANLEDLERAQAWCIEVAPGVTRCAPDCTRPDEICPLGSECYELQGPDADGDGAPDSIVQGDLTASACFPANVCR